jgi:CubicO group peptidase (beta-lactamase class C family)
MGPLESFLASLARPGGVVSAVEALVADAERVLWCGVAGFRVGGEPLVAGAGARFDAASLTKPWMATLALALDAGGELALERRVREIFPDAAGPLAERSLEELLRHCSGMKPWAPLAVRLARDIGERQALKDYLLGEPLEDAGPSPAPLYGDLDYLLWGLCAEHALSEPLGSLLDRCVAAPLGLGAIGDLAAAPPAAVECRLDNGREVELAREQGVELSPQRPVLAGRPQDGNARALGYLTAHAGLFLSADELLALGREWLRPGRLLGRAQVARALAGGGAWAQGWTRASAGGSGGAALSPRAFGHAGFTGGSLWVDPDAGRVYLLLAHRLSSRIDFNGFRREFHRLAGAALPR